jgi:cadmium resistance protein CadD (predicted permease)
MIYIHFICLTGVLDGLMNFGVFVFIFLVDTEISELCHPVALNVVPVTHLYIAETARSVAEASGINNSLSRYDEM